MGVDTSRFFGSEISSMYCPNRSLNSFSFIHSAMAFISPLVTLMSSYAGPMLSLGFGGLRLLLPRISVGFLIFEILKIEI